MESWSAVAAPPAAPRSPDTQPAGTGRNGSAEPPFRATLVLRELGSRGDNERSLRGKSGHHRARAVGNAPPGKPAGKCRREQTADGAAARESRTGKGERVR